MTLHVKDGDTWKTPVTDGVSVKDAGTWKTVSKMYVKKDNTWIEFYPTYVAPGPPDTSVEVALSPTSVSGTRSDTGSVTTNSTTATASGGSGPYTYQWAKVSGDTVTINSPTSATTTFTTTLTGGASANAVYRVTAKDGANRTATADVTISMSASIPPLQASRNPSSVSGQISGAGTAITGSCSVTASGGTGSYTYLWTINTGSFTITNPNSASTAFSKALSNGQTADGSARCTVTDTASNTVQTSLVIITFTSADNIPDLSASRSPATLNKSGTWTSGTLTLTTSACTASASGGVSPYSYSWSRVSGSTSINITSASSSSTTFSSQFTSGGQSRSAVFRCTVSDNAGQVVQTDTVSVTFDALQALTAAAGPASSTKSSASSPVISNAYTCTSAGGTAPHYYQWERVSGSTAISIGNATNSVTSFLWSAGGPGTVSANFRCRVEDGNGTVVYSNQVTVNLTRT